MIGEAISNNYDILETYIMIYQSFCKYSSKSENNPQ